MSLSVGIVGLPNVGKSTLFNALLKRQQALAANYPFATIEPNVGVVPVPDERLEKLKEVTEAAIATSSRQGGTPRSSVPIVPATVEFVDIAGIVAGAHEGEGLGNQFLSHIREVDLIAHVVRDFEDSDVVRTGTSLVDDYQTIVAELIFKDLETVQSQSKKSKKSNDKTKLKAVLDKLEEGFNQGKRALETLKGDEIDEVRDLFLLTMKPQIVVVNVDESRLKEAASISASVAQRCNLKVDEVVVVTAKVESELATLNDEDASLFMAELGISVSGLERLITSAYQRLGLISFLTAGEIEVRAWTISQGAKAPQAAGVIHTDFEKKFIKAEVVYWEDFVTLGGWKQAREAGKVRLEGKDYVMRDGDVVDFKIGS